LTIDDYLNRQRVTGLLIIKGGEILLERYQYERKPTDRFVSHSMAKSLVSLAVGFALEEGLLKSLDDRVSVYLPEMRGAPYGETAIRNLLLMASGVRFNEVYDGKDDLQRFVQLRLAGGTVKALRSFTEREAPEGTRFHYASSETYLLGALISKVTGMSLSKYLEEKLWQPVGAESAATWAIDDSGAEWAAGNFSAVLRDYGRLGTLLANDGLQSGKQILPKDYLLEATDWHRHPEAFAPKHATPSLGYGYQFWILPGEKRRFALIGVYGQILFVDPELKLVMVQTAVTHNASVTKESMGAERYALWRGLVGHFGTW
jgi:CubicO group peptidase (beta-lactamase class C family)